MKLEVIGRPTYGQPAMIVVPKIAKQEFWATVIRPGSSLVAFNVKTIVEDPTNKIVYYEGNVYNASNLVTFKDRALCAYGRMSTKYPTTAMIGDTCDSFEVIGLISPTIFELTESEAYLAWMARSTIPIPDCR